MLKIDRVTSIQSRGLFSRICVEWDLAKSLLPKFIAGGIVLNLEYEGLRMICFKCGKYGHKEIECIDGTRKPKTSNKKMQGKGNSEMNSLQAQPMQAKADFSMEINNLTVQVQGEGSKGEIMHEIGPWMIAQNRNKS